MKLITRDRDLMRNTLLMNFIKIVVTIKVKYYRISMVEQNQNQMGAAGNGKKRMLPSELAHKFSSKEDFLSFFTNQVGNIITV